MRKLLNKPWLVAVLALTAVGLCAYESLAPATPGKNRRRSALAGAPSVIAAPEKDFPSRSDALAAIEALAASSARDPFAVRAVAAAGPAQETAAATTETLKLGAVWLQGEEGFAAINARIVRAGESFGATIVESVTREGAWLRLPSGRRFLSVGAELTHALPPAGAAPLIVATREL